MTGDALTELLAQAHAAFARLEGDEALRLLLDAWRRSRAERLAALVTKLSDQLTAGLPPLEAQLPFPAGPPLRPTDLPRMTGRILESAGRGDAEPLLRQLEGFRGTPADPRLIRLRGGLSEGGRRMLTDAASAYVRVEWV